MGKIARIFHTVRHLKPSQLQWQVLYRLKRPLLRTLKYNRYNGRPLQQLSGFNTNLIPSTGRVSDSKTFRFLNLEKTFEGGVDWNFMEYGKLWNYNLQYFDYLHDASVPQEVHQALLDEFSTAVLNGKVRPEPYPVSLRIINWSLYHSATGFTSAPFNAALAYQIDYLNHNLEHHIQANHLLENHLALYVGALILGDGSLQAQHAARISELLREQILADGGFYECTPMYHCIILSRILLLIQLSPEGSFQSELRALASKMLGWLKAYQFDNRELALFNDAANDIAPAGSVLFSAAEQLHLAVADTALGESGYRKLKNEHFELLIDAGDIMPRYQPGHAHSDMLSCCLQYLQKPVLVDTGVSTYQSNARRQLERSTASHNTVTINGENQSDVWSSFRVARRANIVALEEGPGFVAAAHDGYRSRYAAVHKRRFALNPNALVIVDEIQGPERPAVAHFHFDHSVSLAFQESRGSYLIDGNLEMRLDGGTGTLREYEQALAFNKLVRSTKLEITFSGKLTTKFTAC